MKGCSKGWWRLFIIVSYVLKKNREISRKCRENTGNLILTRTWTPYISTIKSVMFDCAEIKQFKITSNAMKQSETYMAGLKNDCVFSTLNALNFHVMFVA